MLFKTHIRGIPCYCKVLAYTPDTPTCVYGSAMEDCNPPEEGEFEYLILDRNQYPAPWLETLITPAIEAELKEDVHILYEAQAREYAESACQAAAEDAAFAYSDMY